MSELAERFTSAELTDWQAAETTATIPETSAATATQTSGSGTGWTTATRLGVLAGSAAVLTALTTAARGTKGERPEGAANQTETETDSSDGSESSGAGMETDTTETDTDTQGGETDTEGDEEDTDAGMPTDQGTDTDEGTDAETSEETPDTDTDTHNPPQPVDPATHGNTDGEENVSTDSDDSDRPDSDGTEGSGENSTATAGTNTHTDNADEEDSDQDNTNTAPAPPVDPNAETEGDSGIDQSGDGDESVDQGTEAEGANIEVDGAEGAGGTNSTDPEPDAGAAIDGPNPMPMPMPQPNTPGAVTLTGTATEDETLTATVTDKDTLPDATNIRYQWQRNTGANGGFENIAGATGETYTLGDEDVGRNVQVQVNYTDARGEDETVISDVTAAVSNVNDLPTGDVTITGTVRGDETLTANTGALADEDGLPDDAIGYNYQWQRSTDSGGFEDIEDATGQNYTLGDEDVNREVRVQVSYTDGNNTSETLTSTPTAEVGTANIAPTGGVRIDGTVRQGQQLSADTTPLQDADGLPDAEGYRYQWQRTQADDTFADIEDATEQTYTVEAADVDQRLQVVVRYTDGNDTDETLTAATISAAVSNADDPVIDEANTQTGTAGDDFLRSDAGNQRLNGLGGDDLLRGGAGADILDGGAGVDRAEYLFDPANIEIDLETGTGTGGTAEGDVLIRIESISGGNGNDRLTGNNTDNRLNGFFGNDILNGGAGNDRLFGGSSDDRLDGGDGNDRLEGQNGDDILIGGSGNDLFLFRPDEGSDTITDFGTGNDRLEFGGGLFANLAAVRTAATQTDDGNLEIALSETETLTLEGVSLDALTADTVTTLDAEGNDTTTPPADANSASDAPAFELDGLSIDEAAITRLADWEAVNLPAPVEPQVPPSADADSLSAGSANRALPLADPLEPPLALAWFDADLEGYSGL